MKKEANVSGESEEEEVKGDGSDEVDEEPSLNIVDGYFAWFSHNLAIAKVGGSEVDENVGYEHRVHEQVNQRLHVERR